MQNNTHQPPSAEALRRRHESQDPAIGRILLVASLIASVVVASLAIIWVMMRIFAPSRPAGQLAEELGVITAPNLEPLARFAAPHLQVVPREDLLALQACDDRALNTYGWIDRGAGTVRIPIERAMDLIVERGLPTRGTNAPVQTGKSSLGLIQERRERP